MWCPGLVHLQMISKLKPDNRKKLAKGGPSNASEEKPRFGYRPSLNSLNLRRAARSDDDENARTDEHRSPRFGSEANP
jgi:hypothetical protein